MRGSNITNIYVIDSKEYLMQELNEDQKNYIELFANKALYNNLRNELLKTRGDDFNCYIRIDCSKKEMKVFDIKLDRWIACAYEIY